LPTARIAVPYRPEPEELLLPSQRDLHDEPHGGDCSLQDGPQGMKAGQGRDADQIHWPGQELQLANRSYIRIAFWLAILAGGFPTPGTVATDHVGASRSTSDRLEPDRSEDRHATLPFAGRSRRHISAKYAAGMSVSSVRNAHRPSAFRSHLPATRAIASSRHSERKTREASSMSAQRNSALASNVQVSRSASASPSLHGEGHVPGIACLQDPVRTRIPTRTRSHVPGI
jgi:hypothetical protein